MFSVRNVTNVVTKYVIKVFWTSTCCAYSVVQTFFIFISLQPTFSFKIKVIRNISFFLDFLDVSHTFNGCNHKSTVRAITAQKILKQSPIASQHLIV